MVWEVIAGALAAAGLILLLWSAAGVCLLPAGTPGLEAVYRCSGDAPELEQTVRGYVWLRESGLTSMPLRIVDCGLSPDALRRASCLAQRRPYIQIEPEEVALWSRNRS